MTRLPLIALDVDGVVCPLVDPMAGMPTVWPKPAWTQTTDGETHGVAAATPVLAFFTRLHEAGRADIAWHTSWRDRAPRHLAPALGLPAWPVLATQEEYISATGWWKTRAIERMLAQGRKVIWIDDDIPYSESIGDLDSVKAHAGLFTVASEVMEGLTQAHLTLIDNKLKEWGF